MRREQLAHRIDRRRSRVGLVVLLALALLTLPVAASEQARTDGTTATPAPSESLNLKLSETASDSPFAPQAIPWTYYQVAGATLRGRSSTVDTAYDGLGCIHTTGGTDLIINTKLILPDGAIIRYLRLYYYDNSTSGRVSAYLTRYDPGSDTNDLISAASSTSGAGGYGTVLSPVLSEVVDNSNYSYTLIGWPSANDSNLRVCGMRVAYWASSYVVFTDGFESGNTFQWSASVP